MGVGAGVVAAHPSGRGGLGSPGTAGTRFSSHPLSAVTLGKALSARSTTASASSSAIGGSARSLSLSLPLRTSVSPPGLGARRPPKLRVDRRLRWILPPVGPGPPGPLRRRRTRSELRPPQPGICTQELGPTYPLRAPPTYRCSSYSPARPAPPTSCSPQSPGVHERRGPRTFNLCWLPGPWPPTQATHLPGEERGSLHADRVVGQPHECKLSDHVLDCYSTSANSTANSQAGTTVSATSCTSASATSGVKGVSGTSPTARGSTGSRARASSNHQLLQRSRAGAGSRATSRFRASARCRMRAGSITRSRVKSSERTSSIIGSWKSPQTPVSSATGSSTSSRAGTSFGTGCLTSCRDGSSSVINQFASSSSSSRLWIRPNTKPRVTDNNRK
ncbi:uncharacterized protein LOC132523124 [Lagenorhynchus albirostris]|uniref:uncharacterized protein LOC132523124 n=1 Tax=Lagenorhynchus albirostris TaxID=27610 RepID=UPI0028F0F5EC|nr:uncharacterized protein LOC132523124 [Lagenorhynchus albirostris]